MEEERERTIKLHCPSLAKTVPVIASEEQRLDLGSIARTFGLDPWSLRLNGHYISRGKDLISPSVTWRSLLSFFSSKGLSTGTDDRDALIVDGKLVKCGTKRGNDAATEPKIICNEKGNCRRRQLDDSNVSEKDRIYRQGNREGLKRKKLLLDDLSLFKKLKVSHESASEKEEQGNKNNGSSIFRIPPFSCRSINERLKRRRDDEAIEAAPAPAPCKRIR